ncbi:prefoldin subunit alpha [Nanoarchaeota archaeon]|nr:MAG: prefoldin subunit alpha [Nanoarchaeota archaeon]
MVREVRKEISPKEVERSAIEMELVRQRMQELEQHLVMLETRIQELEVIKSALESLEADRDALIPIGPGVLVKGKILDKEKVLMEVGANFVIEKDVEGAKETIERSQEKIEKAMLSMKAELADLYDRMREIEQILLQYYGG